MLDSLGKGTGDFKQFENLSKELSSIVSEVQNLSKAFGKVDDSGTKTLLSSIQNIDKSLSELSQHILNVNKNMSNIGGDTNGTVKQVENISNAYDNASKSAEKLVEAQSKIGNKSNISVDKEINALEKAVSKFKSQAAGLAIKPDDQHQFSSWTNDLDELNAKIEEYNSKVKYLKENNIVDGEQVDKVKKLRDEIEQTINAMSKTPQAKRGWTDIGVSKAAEKVANVLKQNTKMSKEARDAIRAYYNELRSGNPSQPIDEILVKVNQLVQKERELGRVGKSFGEIFKEKVIYGGAAQLAGMVGFYDVINVGREGFQTIRELDTALVDLKKTTAMNSSQLEEFYFDSNDVAKQMGVTTQAIIDQASAWSRLNKIGLLYGDI